MKLLSGEFFNSLDEKGRVSLPARLREELAQNNVIITKGIERCLWLFGPEAWQELSQKLVSATSPFNTEARQVQRRIISPAQELEMDKLGRISIPQGLREWAGLSKECVILGMSRYLEIWDAAAHRTYMEENEAKFIESTEKFSDLHL